MSQPLRLEEQNRGPFYFDVEDELAPEVDDPLQEVHPTSLPKCKPPKAKAPCDQCEMVCKTTFLLNRHKKARHGNTEAEVAKVVEKVQDMELKVKIGQIREAKLHSSVW